MKVISIFNNKGGVGKTTSAVNIASELGKQGYKVLLMDLDSQCNASSYIGESYPPSQGTYSLFKGEDVSVSITPYDNLWIIPASINLISIEEELEVDAKSKVVLNNYLKDKNEIFDFVILDCPPSIGLITINALIASDYVVIPIKISKFDLDGFETLFNTISAVKEDFNKSLKIAGVFITMDRKVKFYKKIKNELREELQKLFMNQSISESTVISRSTFEEKPLAYLSRNSKAYKEYKLLVEELLCRVI